MNFLTALAEHEFLRVVLVAGLLSALGCGVVGSLVVVKRITFMAGGIAHAVLGGMGVAQWLGGSPLVGATVAAILAALLIGWISHRGHQREDMLIGAVWAVGMAAGIVAIAQTPGYSSELMSYLLGNLLMVTREQVWLMAALNAAMLLMLALFWRPLMATVFDEEFARVRGLPTLALNLGLLVMIALAVVVLVQAVGLVLVMALLTLPAATALLVASSIGRVMLLAAGIAAVDIVGGLAVAYETDSPAGAVIVLGAATVYLLALSAQGLRRRKRHSTVPASDAARCANIPVHTEGEAP
jgi:zinc transport system permease protein